MLFAGGFCLYIVLIRFSFKRQARQAADYLRRINQGDYRLVMADSTEGEISILKGELYKTAIYLRESAENAKADKLLLKDALSDISHQLKTPLTSLSINLEIWKEILIWHLKQKQDNAQGKARCGQYIAYGAGYLKAFKA